MTLDFFKESMQTFAQKRITFGGKCQIIGGDMAATIKDIAKQVGVNPSTVSRVINGTASISDETKQKIREAMEQLDYHPNSNARSLVNGSTFTIGLVIDASNSEAFSNDFFIRSVSAIEAVVQEKGFNLLICSNRNKLNKNTIENMILEKKVDGLILPVSVINNKLVMLLKKYKFPFVIMGNPGIYADETSWVDMDNACGSREAVLHLYNSGYTKPALLVEDRTKIFEMNRLNGYKESVRIAEERMDEYIFESDLLRETLSKDIENFLNKNKDIDCLICTNNDVAYNALKVIKRMGKGVPKDYGVMTFDNYPLSMYMDPPLSVIDVDTYKLGEEAAKMLFYIIRESSDLPRHTLVPTSLIIRQSTMKGE